MTLALVCMSAEGKNNTGNITKLIDNELQKNSSGKSYISYIVK